MALKIRMSRGGAKKRPYYRIVVADSRMPRDGRFIERVGIYNPLLPKDHTERLQLELDRIKHWLEKGAKPSDRVARFLDEAGMWKRTERNNPQKAVPGVKAQERLAAKQEAEETAKKLRKLPKKLRKLLQKNLLLKKHLLRKLLLKRHLLKRHLLKRLLLKSTC